MIYLSGDLSLASTTNHLAESRGLVIALMSELDWNASSTGPDGLLIGGRLNILIRKTTCDTQLGGSYPCHAFSCRAAALKHLPCCSSGVYNIYWRYFRDWKCIKSSLLITVALVLVAIVGKVLNHLNIVRAMRFRIRD
jgi:hypothetical protein